MFDEYKSQLPDIDPDETQEWLDSMAEVIDANGPERASYLCRALIKYAHERNVGIPTLTQTPYVNTIPPELEPPFPGDEMMEKRIRRIIRWNAMAMVTRANNRWPGIGGHISSYASSASLYEVGFNHFFRGKDHPGGGDLVYFQGHAIPGIYARAFLEGRLTEDQLDRFRSETGGDGLSSYPHPWLMPNFWEFPTVSMGLGPIAAIYQARFCRYLQNRGLKDTSQNRVWAYLGDGECDEPETLGALSIAAREGLDNLYFVVNCNLQRLDGPVRGNGKIIQELESVFRGAGWHVIKVVWGPEWDPLLAKDEDGVLLNKMNDTVDGAYQKFAVADGAYVRENFFGPDPRLREIVADMSDKQLEGLRRGGHSYRKLYAAYAAAVAHKGAPVAILVKTVKGWTLGEGFEASNVTHQMKKLDEDHLRKFRDTLHLPIPDSRLADAPYYHPGKDSPEVAYMLERRKALGGSVPERRGKRAPKLETPQDDCFAEFWEGSKAGVEVSSTMAFVRLLRALMRDKKMGKHVVPITPDEARTFGMDAFFREFGIYAALGQKYEPIDSKMFLNYHESKSGQLLEEGITEAGSMASFTASGTSYASLGVVTIPFYIFYSMFGFQRTADQIWAFGDARGRGFLLGATAGRTTLNGEGLQHEDGHSHLYALSVPNCMAYDPAYAYETAIIVRDGLRRMLEDQEDVFYYITLYNENYVMPAMPKGKKVEEGILRGMYKVAKASGKHEQRVQLFGSGTILQEVLKAQKILSSKFGVDADVWSITSYQQLYRDARAVARHNRLNPGAQKQSSFIDKALKGHEGPVIAASDWIQELPSVLAGHIDRRFVPLGTNGFGRSDTRENLRAHFGVDAPSIAGAALSALHDEGALSASSVRKAMAELGVAADRPDSMTA